MQVLSKRLLIPLFPRRYFLTFRRLSSRLYTMRKYKDWLVSLRLREKSGHLYCIYFLHRIFLSVWGRGEPVVCRKRGSRFSTGDQSWVRFASCTDGHHPKKGIFLHFMDSKCKYCLCIRLYNTVYIISSAGQKHEGVTSSAFILGPVRKVTNTNGFFSDTWGPCPRSFKYN